MNRLFVLLAAGLLGTGCVSGGDTCDAHRVLITWPSFVVATSTSYVTTASCEGISQINVYVDGSEAPIVRACDQDFVEVDLLTGGHTVRVDALDAGGYPILRDELSFRISDACGGWEVATQPGEGWVTINYGFGGQACVPSSYMWFNVHDEIAGVDIAGVNGGSQNPDQYLCNASYISPPFTLPAGQYTLDWIQEMYWNGAADRVSAAYCNPTSFAVNSGVDTSTPRVDLLDTTSSCF